MVVDELELVVDELELLVLVEDEVVEVLPIVVVRVIVLELVGVEVEFPSGRLWESAKERRSIRKQE